MSNVLSYTASNLSCHSGSDDIPSEADEEVEMKDASEMIALCEAAIEVAKTKAHQYNKLFSSFT